MEKKMFNLVLIGDGYVGKTSLFEAAQKHFTQNTYATVYNEFIFEREIKDQKVSFKLMDTAGQEEFDQLRKVYYRDCDLFIVCFCLDDKTSYENVITKWRVDIEDYRAPRLLVGTKSDLVKRNNVKITPSMSEKLQKKIGAVGFIPCSAIQNRGVTEIIEFSVDILTRNQKKSCEIQ